MKPHDSSRWLRYYVLAVSLGGPLLALAVAVARMDDAVGAIEKNWEVGLRAGLLLVLSILFAVTPLRIGKEYTLDLGDVAAMAMVILLPTALPGALAILGGGLSLLVRRRSMSDDAHFNLGVAALTVTVAAGIVHLLDPYDWAGPELAGLHGVQIGAVVAASVARILLNYALVAGAISLQTGTHFRRILLQAVAGIGGFGTSVLLAALGVVMALVVRDYPVAVPVIVVPAYSLHLATRRSVALRDETRAAMAQLVEVVELRDPYTVGHSRRVAELGRRLALRLGMTSEEADLIETAGHVHDLGKIAISPQILLKYGPLDARDWREVKRHPDHGALVIDRYVAFHGCARMVRYHHERWDGTGYPAGLAGEAIPYGARILAVADAYDALTHLRSYRAAKSPEAALAILEEGAGSQWDPVIVQAMVALVREAAEAEAAVAAARAGAPQVAHA